MSFDIKLPNINAGSDSGQIAQIRSYLYQLAEQLKWALNSIEAGGASAIQTAIQSGTKNAVATEIDAKATFNSIKSLIIKSADIVDAYYEEMSKTFSGEYVAQSDFGTYKEQTSQTIIANSTNVEQLFSSQKTIETDLEEIHANLNALIETQGYIKTGKIDETDEGYDVIGIEIGQTNKKDGEEVFNKYARFTSDRLSFYDKNDIEVAYISDFKLYITNAHITGTLTLGRYDLDTSNGIVFKWV